MSLFITTQSYRNDIPTEYGYLLKIDKTSGEIIQRKKIATPVKGADYNERIKPGLRGISIFDNKIYTATWNSVVILDIQSFQIKKIISHNWMSDLHGIFVDHNGIWITSSLPDAVILYNFDGFPISSLWLPETFLYKNRVVIDKSIDWRHKGKSLRGFKEYHANHIEVRDNSVFVTGRGQGAKGGRIIELDKASFINNIKVKDSDISLFAENLHGPHDGIWDNNNVWATETLGSTIACISKTGKIRKRKKITEKEHEKIHYKDFKEYIKYQIKEKLLQKPGKRMTHWTRGLSIDDKHIFIGQSTKAGEVQSRARIIKIDKKRLKIVGCFYLEIDNYPETRIFQIYQKKINGTD
jgi:hypothetical protein